MNPEQNDLHSLPEGISRELPFMVPDGYFDRLPQRIQHRIQEEQKATSGKVHYLFRPAPLLAMAACLVLALTFLFRFFNMQESPSADSDLTNFVYQEGIIDEWNEDDILNYGGVAVADSVFFGKNDKETEAMQEFLVDEGIDESDILLEL